METQDELKDIEQAIRRYIVSNGHRVAFIARFVAFDKEDDLKEDAGRIFIYGGKGMLKIMQNEIKDVIKEEVDEDDFVNV